MSVSLKSAFAKLDGADERLNKLKEEIHRGAVTDLLKFGTERDAEGRVIVLVKELAQVPPEWHVWIGECVHDIRSALDHLAFALNIRGSRSEPPPNHRRSQFPLYTEADRFALMAEMSDRERCMIGYFPEGARTLVERLQPYHARDQSDLSESASWLWVLAELSNIDKHRHFPITAVFPDLITHPGAVEGHAVADIKSWHIPLQVGAPIMRLVVPSLPSSTTEPQVDFGYMGGLNFQGEEAEPPLPLVLEQEPVDFVLPETLEAVRSKVFPAFAPFLE